LSLADQGSNYFRFIREAMLRTDALTRAQLNEVNIRSGQRSPNEAREKDDYSSYPDGDQFYMSANYAGTGLAAPTNSPGGNNNGQAK
jgi:hypothetical protein